jgi:hypothetical protein
MGLLVPCQIVFIALLVIRAAGGGMREDTVVFIFVQIHPAVVFAGLLVTVPVPAGLAESRIHGNPSFPFLSYHIPREKEILSVEKS